MLSVNQALEKILACGAALNRTENVFLVNALDRVLTTDYLAPIDVPPADNSAMDGYAIFTGDLNNPTNKLFVSQRIPAGSVPEALKPGTAARIFTGGVVPEGANAVVIQENTGTEGDSVLIQCGVNPGDNIRPKGQDVKCGSTLFKKGHTLRPQDIGLLASCGIAELKVFQRPTVAIIATGNELREPGKALGPGQIYNSNKHMLTALLQKAGVDIYTPEGIVKDSLDATIAALKNCANHADLIISTGGVSVGDEDYIKPAVEKTGEIHNWKVKLKPGKPLVFGKVENALFLGLPGNPVSSFVTFLLFAMPLIRKLSGTPLTTVKPQAVPLAFDIEKPAQRPEFMRVFVGQNGAERYANQSSGVLASTTWANALAYIPEDTVLRKGDYVDIYFINDLMNKVTTS